MALDRRKLLELGTAALTGFIGLKIRRTNFHTDAVLQKRAELLGEKQKLDKRIEKLYEEIALTYKLNPDKLKQAVYELENSEISAGSLPYRVLIAEDGAKYKIFFSESGELTLSLVQGVEMEQKGEQTVEIRNNHKYPEGRVEWAKKVSNDLKKQDIEISWEKICEMIEDLKSSNIRTSKEFTTKEGIIVKITKIKNIKDQIDYNISIALPKNYVKLNRA